MEIQEGMLVQEDNLLGILIHLKKHNEKEERTVIKMTKDMAIF
jgi:hypothetical protein